MLVRGAILGATLVSQYVNAPYRVCRTTLTQDFQLTLSPMVYVIGALRWSNPSIVQQPEGEMGGDLPELDDCEEDDHFDPDDEWDDEAWEGYTLEQIEQFKILGARLEKEEVNRL